MSYLAVDLGTTNIKAILYDDNLEPLAQQSERVVYQKQDNRVEFDAEEYFQILLRLIAGCCSQAYSRPPYPVAQIVLTGQAESLVPLDGSGRPSRRAISWLDMRSQAECEELRRVFEPDMSYRVTGQPEIIPTWPATKILWIRKNEPDCFAKTAKYLLLKDYILFRLSGEIAGDHTIYNFSHYFDIVRKTYWADMLRYCGVSESQLPMTVPSCTVIGSLTASCAQVLGIPPTAKVNVGTLDHFAGMIGTGNIKPGTVSESTGTVLALASLVDRPLFTPERLQLHCGPFEGTYVFLPVCESGGISLEWFKNAFLENESFEEMNRACAGKQLPGGMVFLPYLTGANAPDFNMDASGVFFGFKEHSDKYDFALAVMEGVAHMLHRNIRQLASAGIHAGGIISTGGGSKSALWCQMKADITGCTVKVPENTEAACLGAAIIGAVSEGRFQDYESAVNSCVRMKTEYTPIRQREYSMKTELYDSVYAGLQASFRLHAKVRREQGN